MLCLVARELWGKGGDSGFRNRRRVPRSGKLVGFVSPFGALPNAICILSSREPVTGAGHGARAGVDGRQQAEYVSPCT